MNNCEHGQDTNCLYCEIQSLQQVILDQDKALEISINQLRGVSLAIKKHRTNIDPAFFIHEYEKMAQEKEETREKHKKLIEDIKGE